MYARPHDRCSPWRICTRLEIPPTNPGSGCMDGLTSCDYSWGSALMLYLGGQEPSIGATGYGARWLWDFYLRADALHHGCGIDKSAHERFLDRISECDIGGSR